MPETLTVMHQGEDVTVGRRLYVGNLSYRVRWQDLKDEFKQYGNVVYATVKENREGRSAGCGIVEFETPEEAADAMVRAHDTELEGRKMFVRQDKDDRDLGGKGNSGGGRGKGSGGKGGKGRGSYGDRYGGSYDDYDRYDSYGGRDRYDDRRGRDYDSYDRYGGSGGKGSKGFGGRGGGRGRSEGGDPGCRVFVSNLAWRVSWQDLKDHFRTVGDVVRADVFLDDAGRSRGNGIVEFRSPDEARRAIRDMNESMLQDRTMYVREDREAGGTF